MTTLSDPGIRRHALLLPALLLLAMLGLLASSPAQAFGNSGNSLFGGGNGDFLPVDEALPFNFSTDQGAVVLSWDITPGHYLYKSRIRINPVTEGVTLGEPD
ncbi:MAG: protein-disulfide reductase DsbD domain-containing protein, partial [Marinobacter vinifirmus]